MRRLTVTLLFLSSMLAVSAGAALTAESLDRRRKALADLIAGQWEYTLSHAPEYASILGDKRFNDRLSDVSAAGQRRGAESGRRFLRRFEAIDTTGFSDQERLNRDLMIRNLRQSIEDFEAGEWEMPVNQMSGVHLSAAQLPSYLSFTSVRDYDDYITRLGGFPKVFDDTIAVMRVGMRARLIPPRFLLETVAVQAGAIAAARGDTSPFAVPLANFPAAVPEAERARIRTAVTAAIDGGVGPAYARFAKFVHDEYAPAGRADAGLWSLPGGAGRYARRARESTTTTLSPAEIHEIGLREVARIEGEMLAIAEGLGYPDLKAFNAAVEKNPDLRAKSPAQILTIYRGYISQMYARLPELFGRLPKARVEVVEVESFRAKEAAAAEYNAGSADGSRPGRVTVNTYEAQSRKTISMESTAYHEGVPGHHMQIAIAQELTGLPQFRRHGGYNAFVEGWALYSERLGKEAGFYQDPWNDYGRLGDEMLRAIRLVVDTGLHSKKWTRQQVVDYFHEHSALDEVEVQAETDRYIVWPGQALGYKIGQLKIVELRERARRELGAGFDIRAFHDQVLGAGALPLDVLERRIDDWIAARKKM